MALIFLSGDGKNQGCSGLNLEYRKHDQESAPVFKCFCLFSPLKGINRHESMWSSINTRFALLLISPFSARVGNYAVIPIYSRIHP